MVILEEILPVCPARCGKKLRKFTGVTIHETANPDPTATAKNHMIYMRDNGGKNKEVSYHYVVDDAQAYHLIPNDEVAWHAGDGANGKGNNETIAIEICVNQGGDFTAAAANAALLAAALLHEKGMRSANGTVFEHHDWSPWGKNCPAQLRAGQAGGMAALRCRAQQKLDEMWGMGKAESPPVPNAPADPAAGSSLPAETLWRVQAGAFADKAGADAYAGVLQKAGFPAFVTQSGKE